MDGFYEVSESEMKAISYRQEVLKERLVKIKEQYLSSLGKVYLRNPEFTSKKNDRRVFKVEYVNEKLGVLFSTIDDTKYLAESSLYIPFNTEQVTFLSSLVEQTEPIETYRIRYYEKKVTELQDAVEGMSLNMENAKASLGHFQKKIEEEQLRLENKKCI